MDISNIIEKLKSTGKSKYFVDLPDVCSTILNSEYISLEVKQSIVSKIQESDSDLKRFLKLIKPLKTQLYNLKEAINWRSQAKHPKCIICGADASVSIHDTYLCSHHHSKYMDSELSLPEFYDLLTYIRDCNLLERDKSMLRQYNLGSSLADIAEKESISRQSVGAVLQKIPWYYPRVRMSKTTKSINPKHKICLAGEKDYPLYDLCPYCYGHGDIKHHVEDTLIVAKDGSANIHDIAINKFLDYHYVRCRDCNKSWLVLCED